MSSFTTPLVVSPLPDGRRWRLYLAFVYHVGDRWSRDVICVPRGFITDFASIPKVIFWLLPWWAKFSKPSPLHDWLYTAQQIQGKPITRRKADDIFYEAMLIAFRDHISGKLVAFIEYWAVRLFGWPAWHFRKEVRDQQ